MACTECGWILTKGGNGGLCDDCLTETVKDWEYDGNYRYAIDRPMDFVPNYNAPTINWWA